MKIISKQRDYYDGVQAYNDSSVMFLRKQQDFFIKEHEKFDCKNLGHIAESEITQTFDYTHALQRHIWRHSRWEREFKNFNTKLIFIGFCGNIYIGVMFELDVINKHNTPTQVCFSYDEFIKLLNKYTTKSEKKDCLNNNGFKRFIEHKQRILALNPTKISHDLFFKYNTPCFIIIPATWRNGNDDKFIVSPTLKDYQFAKVFDPYTAFQEIEMFLGGVLGRNEEPSTIDDRSMLYKKGFNDMSFKTYKGTKKPRRRK